VGEGCGHAAALLYQLADYKALGKNAVPSDIAKTSLPENFRKPRGAKIGGDEIQTLHCKGYSKDVNVLMANEKQGIKSTLYMPVQSNFPNLESLGVALEEVAPSFLAIPALKLYNQVPKVNTKLGPFPHGSVLAVQQKLHEHFLVNIYDGVQFPNLPCENFIDNNVNTVLLHHEALQLEDLQLNQDQIARFEEQTRLQSDSPLWHQLRENRITASKIHSVFIRQRNFDNLLKQLKSKRRVQTKAMKDGITNEPLAAIEYNKVTKGSANIYPCGIVISPWACWIAASPDRKVYMPDRIPPFGLLEIKCPQADSVLEVKYLDHTNQGLKLHVTHQYYTQVQTQMAITGLHWCDFFVWCTDDSHLETIHFDPIFWQSVKDKVDMFYFDYFVKCVQIK
jgi:putative phage-type endonuclease